MATTTIRYTTRLIGLPFTWLTKRDGIIFILLVAAAFNYQRVLEPPIDTQVPILERLDTLSVSANLVSSHNTDLLGVLQEYHSSGRTLIASAEGIQMQARMFYCAILAVILSLLPRRLKKWLPTLLLCSLIFFMYLLDVHLEDQLLRQRRANSVIGHAIDSLVNVTTLEEDWYSLNTKQFTQQVAQPSEWPSRWWRKLDWASQPSLPQIIFYFVPAFGMYLYATGSRRKGRTLSDIKGLRGA